MKREQLALPCTGSASYDELQLAIPECVQLGSYTLCTTPRESPIFCSVGQERGNKTTSPHTTQKLPIPLLACLQHSRGTPENYD